MLKKIVVSTIVCLIFLSVILWTGCSDDDKIVSGSASESLSGVSYYFPLNPGQTFYYSVNYANGTNDEVVIKVGAEITFGGTTATQWFVNSELHGLDTNFIRVQDSSVYFYESYTSLPQQILALPLTLGATWDRYVTITTGDDDSTTVVNPPDKYDDDGGEALSIGIPVSGLNAMTVDNVESIATDKGSFFSGAVRVKNTADDGKVNYYWFVPGVGLAKYVLGTTDANYPNGEVVGELISY